MTTQTNTCLKAGTQGTPLTIIETKDFESWLSQQTSQVQAWLNSTGFKGEGFRLVPGDEGASAQVVVGVANRQSPFVCGDLPTTLPAGEYLLEGEETLLRAAAFSWGLGAYRFDRYKNPANDKRKANATLVLSSSAIIEEAERSIAAVSRVRDLINTPAGDMMPENLGEAVEALAREFGAEVSQIVGDELLEKNFPAIHAVGRASAHAPRLIDLRWGDPSDPRVTLVGKGVCFDSGGLDLKPADAMRRMKKDMGGSANAIGLAQLIMAHELPVRLRLLIPAVENAVSGNAYRPGDVLSTRKGITVEVDNTDAEGRLVLCDALAEAVSESPALLIDLATLTGANTAALGAELPGLYSRDVDLAREIADLGAAIEDPLWPMPIHTGYADALESPVADTSNCGTAIKNAGNITAALYLALFVEETTPWLHVDFMAWNERPRPGRPVGGEALGIRALYRYLAQRFGSHGE